MPVEAGMNPKQMLDEMQKELKIIDEAIAQSEAQKKLINVKMEALMEMLKIVQEPFNTLAITHFSDPNGRGATFPDFKNFAEHVGLELPEGLESVEGQQVA